MAADLQLFVAAGTKVARTMDELVQLARGKLNPEIRGEQDEVITKLRIENRLMRRMLSELTANGPLHTSNEPGPEISLKVAGGLITVARVPE
jgi:hypothetical protein